MCAYYSWGCAFDDVALCAWEEEASSEVGQSWVGLRRGGGPCEDDGGGGRSYGRRAVGELCS